jgi:hypothetical protein
MDVSKFETANSWFSAMHAKGYSVPITLCQAAEKLMKIEKLTFAEAYNRLETEERITFEDSAILFE